MVRKELELHPRVAKQDAKNAVRDAIDALIELITNSMDSYNRMKGRGEFIPEDIDGKIEIYLKKNRKEQKAVIACKDWAEGISPDKMERYISGYGYRTSGKEVFQSIRGYFGRGLKDAAGGLDGIGWIYSRYGNTISVGIIDGTDKNKITYEPPQTYESNEKNLKKFHLDDGSKTIAMVEFSTKDRTVPNFDTFAKKLTLCVQLRPLMMKGKVKLIHLQEGKPIRKRTLKYTPPHGTQLLLENKNIIPGTTATYDIEIYKADEPLSQGEEGKFREGGLLIMSGTSVHEATLLKFERDPNASKFFGKVRCDYIDELMRKDEAVVTPDRQGLNWDHPFMKKLKAEIEKKLQPFVDKEKKERDKYKKGMSKDTLKRNEILGKKLGKLYKKIMEEETGLEPIGGKEHTDEKDSRMPSMGFEFIPNWQRIECKKKEKTRLVIESPKVIPSYEKVELFSTNKDIVLEEDSYLVSEGEYREDKGIYILRPVIFGTKEGITGEIIAKTRNKRGEECIAKISIDVKKRIDYPPNGFAFVPDKYRVKIEKTNKLRLKIDSDLIENDHMSIKIMSNNKYIVVDTPMITVSKEEKGILEKSVVVRGKQTGQKGIITAQDIDNPLRKAEAEVKVISTTKTSSPKGFRIEFDDSPRPIQRAVCKENVIYIFTEEPIVKKYYGKTGEYTDTLSFQVLCADLITDAFCTKIIEDLGEKIVYPGIDRETAVRREFNKLKSSVGPIIHEIYVKKSLLEKDREGNAHG